jgi:hypothetical protein
MHGRPLLRTRADDVASWRVLVTVPHGSSAASMPIIFRLLDPLRTATRSPRVRAFSWDHRHDGIPYDPRRGRWIPWVIAGAMLTVVAVNAVLITAAVSTFTGTTQRQTYATGRTFNHVLEEAARQRAMGWTANLRREGGQILLDARGRDGAALAHRHRTERPCCIALSRELNGRWCSPPTALGAGPPGSGASTRAMGGPSHPGLAPSGEHWDMRERLILP